jgi:ABC-2 type transport system permease protein
VNSTETIEAPRAFGVLARANLLQVWRRILAIRSQSRLLTSLIGVFIFGYWWLSFLLFQKALKFAGAFPGLGNLLIERMIYLLFAFLFSLLLISNLLISYTNLFRNRETSHLLCLPISPQTIYRWKFLESTLLASWAFLFLVIPLLVAFGMEQNAGWEFYIVTTTAMFLFIVLPAVAGSAAAILIARFLDRRLFQILTVVLAAVIVGTIAFWMQPDQVTDEMLETRVLVVLDRLLSNTRFALFPFLPSYWLSSGILQWAEGARSAAGFFLSVLVSYVLFFGTLAFTRAGKPFYEAASAVRSRSSVLGRWKFLQRGLFRKRGPSYRRGPVEGLVGMLVWLAPDVRSVIVKDIRVFWRDTTQWGQSLMLFGLLGVYILNLRHFSSQLNNPFWIHLVSYLNLGACSLNLATLTTRFVYPQFSLEGKRLWIVGMAPLGLVRVVRAKYWLGCCTSLIITVGLVSLSSYMLNMAPIRIAFFAGVVAVMTMTLNGLAMGLGTLYPNFKEDNPSKIVSGFGGTFCLVLSFLYIVFSVVILALGSPWRPTAGGPEIAAWLVWVLFLGVSLLLGWLPGRIGNRYLRDLEI